MLRSFLRKFFKKAHKFSTANNPTKESDWSSLTILPGIGMKNGRFFFEAGFTTPRKVLSASDKELLMIPGVGKEFIKRLRAYR